MRATIVFFIGSFLLLNLQSYSQNFQCIETTGGCELIGSSYGLDLDSGCDSLCTIINSPCPDYSPFESFLVPISFTFVNHSSDPCDMDVAILDDLIENTNIPFFDSGSRIRFELKGFFSQEIDDLLSTGQGLDPFDYVDQLTAEYPPVIRSIHVYVTCANGSYVPGIGGYINSQYEPTIVLSAGDFKIDDSTLAHELGHIFGLYHTHTEFFGATSCNSDQCSTGDKINDTPFDNEGFDSNGDCTPQNPLQCGSFAERSVVVRNLMSYYSDECRIAFTQCQAAKMNDVLFKCHKSLCGSQDINDFIDSDSNVSASFEVCLNEVLEIKTHDNCYSWYEYSGNVDYPLGQLIESPNGIFIPPTDQEGSFFYMVRDNRYSYDPTCALPVFINVLGDETIPSNFSIDLVDQNDFNNILPFDCGSNIVINREVCKDYNICFNTENENISIKWDFVLNGSTTSVFGHCWQLNDFFYDSVSSQDIDVNLSFNNCENKNFEEFCSVQLQFSELQECYESNLSCGCFQLGIEDYLIDPSQQNLFYPDGFSSVEFYAISNCFIWVPLVNGIIDLSQAEPGSSYIPTNIQSEGIYQYAIFDQRNFEQFDDSILDRSCYEIISVVVGSSDIIESSDLIEIQCYQAGETVDINWNVGDEPTLRLSLSIDGGASWIFPNDIGLADDGFGMTINNDGNYEWKIPCISDVPGLEIVATTNAMLGLFDDNGFGFQTNGNGLIDASQPFEIKKCDNCLDLVIDELSSYPPNQINGGDNVWIPALVSNHGIIPFASTPDCQIEFYFSDDQVADMDEYIENEQLGNLELGNDDEESTNFQVPYDIPDGQYYFIAKLNCVTDQGSLCEESEYILPVFKGNAEVDLQIVSASANPSEVAPDCPFLLTTNIRNNGTLDVDDTSMGVYLSTNNTLDNGDIFLFKEQVPHIFAGETYPELGTINIPVGLSDGTYYIILQADFDEEEAEANEFNNLYSFAIEIENVADIAISNTSLSTSNIVGNSMVDFSFDVSNLGSISSSITDYSICLSSDNVEDNSDLTLLTGSLPTLLSGELASISGQLNIPTLSSSGQQYIFIKTDVSDNISEKSEENNDVTLQVMVAPFDLTCEITPAECGGSNGSMKVAPSGGTAPFMYVWETGATTNEITSLSADFYTVTVTDGNGSTAKKSGYVSDNGDPKWEFVDAFEVEMPVGGRLFTTTTDDNQLYGYHGGTNTLYHYDENGLLVRTKTYTGIQNVLALGAGINGVVYLIGDHFSIENGIMPNAPLSPPPATDQEIIKLDGNLDLVDTEHINTIGLALPLIEVNSNGDLYFVTTGAFNLSNGHILYKYDSNLNVQSQVSFYTTQHIDGGHAIQNFVVTKDDNVIVASNHGWTYFSPFAFSSYPYGPFNFQSYLGESLIANFDSNLSLNWVQKVSDTFITFPFLDADQNGDIIYGASSFTPTAPLVNLFNAGYSGNHIFKLNKSDGSILASSPGAFDLFTSSENGIDVGMQFGVSTTFDILNNGDLSDIQILEGSRVGGFSIYSTNNGGSTTDENGCFNYLLNCTTGDCTMGDFNISNPSLFWTKICLNEMATSHSINLPDSLHLCYQESRTLDAENAGFDFLWSTGETTQTIEVADAGKYFVTVTNDEGCDALDSVEIFLLEEIEMNASVSSEFCSSQNGSIELMPQRGLAPYTYLWEDGSTSNMINALQAGDYKVTLTDDNGCSLVSTISVNADAGITDADFIVQPTTCGIQNGSITMDVIVGGDAPYLALWNDGVNSLNRSGLSDGTYSVTITDNNGCQWDESFIINASQKLVVTQNLSSPLSCSSSDGSITLTPQNGQMPYTYLWADGNSSATRSDLASGFHSVTITENSGCSIIEQVDIPDFVESNIAYTSTNATCSNGSIALDANQLTTNTQIAWSTGATTSSLTNLLPGFYEVTLTDENNCLSSERIEITGNQVLRASIQATTILCQDLTPVEAMAEGGVNPYMYAWSNGDNTASTELMVGTHTVTITDQAGCSIVKEYVVENQSNAGLISFEPDKTICDGESAAIQLFIEGVVGPFEITLTDGQNEIVISGYNLLDEMNVRPNATTTYSIVSIADGLGCIATSSDEITITVNPRIQLVANLLDVQTCQGTSAKVEPIIIGGTAPYIITYNDGTNIYTQDNFTNGDQVELITANSNVYYFTNITDANGCNYSFIDQVTITETPCTISNNFLPSDPCSCNEDQSANGAMDGTFSETISVSVTAAGQTWTIKTITSLQPTGTLPTGLAVGDPLSFDAVNNRHIATFNHTDLSGYSISVEGPNEVGNINNVVLDFMNVCQYPALNNNAIASELNLCQMADFSFENLNGEISNLPGALLIYLDGQFATGINLENLGVGTYQVLWDFEGDFVSNQNGTLASPAYPGCNTSVLESFEVVEDPLSVACNDVIHASMDQNCDPLLSPSSLLEAEVATSYSIEMEDGQVGTASSDIDYFVGIDWSQYPLNENITYTISSNCGIMCWGEILLEDKLAPSISCPSDVIVPCFDDSVPYTLEEFAQNFVQDNCGDFTVHQTRNEIEEIDCHQVINGTYTAVRTLCYIAIDEHGNQSEECCFNLNYLKADLSDVVIPSNVSLKCSDYPNWNNAVNVETGVPIITLNGESFDLHSNNNSLCKINVSFADQVIPICGKSYKVLREWSILDWCSGTLEKRNQFIEIKEESILIDFLQDQYQVGTMDYQCSVNYTMNIDQLVLTDLCGSASEFKIYTQNTTVQTDCNLLDASFPFDLVGTSASFNNLPSLELALGCHLIKYEVVSICGQRAEKIIELEVRDETAPSMVCEEHTVVSLTLTGEAIMEAISLDDGSNDNCSDVRFGIRRADICSSSNIIEVENINGVSYYDAVKFCCSDVGNEVEIELVGLDESGNYNICKGFVFVQDVSNPTFDCPDVSVNTTHSCDFLADPFFGEPTVSTTSQNCPDNFRIDLIENIRSIPDECGTYRITKKWQIINENSDAVMHTCAQVIELENIDLFVESDITWPDEHLEVMSCDIQDASPEFLVEPMLNDNDCSLASFTFVDQVFENVDGYCYKIIRTWSVIDWCQFDPNDTNTDGQWSFVQTIVMSDITTSTRLLQGRVQDIHGESFEDAEVSLIMGDTILTKVSNEDGYFSFGEFAADQLFEMDATNNDDPMNGVSTLDLVLIQKHILGVDTLDRMEDYMSADVNNSQHISAIDLIELRKLILGIYVDFPNNESWRFIRSSSVQEEMISSPWPFTESIILGPTDPFLEEYRFTAIKVGDVNGSAELGNVNGSIVEIRSDRNVELHFEDVQLNRDETLLIPIYSESENEIFGMQGTWCYDPSVIDLVGIQSGLISVNSSDYARHSSNEGFVTISIASPEGMQFNRLEPLFYLEMQARENTNLESLDFCSEITRNEVYLENLETAEIQLARKVQSTSIVLYQNSPNPFSEETTIGFYLPKSQKVNLIVYDLQGRSIYSKKILAERGDNSLNIGKNEIRGSGVLLYKLISEDGTLSKKMMKLQ